MVADRVRGAAHRDRSTGALPTLVVIGAQKCGTSALHEYLGVHPDVAMTRPKELNFFLAERNWGRGVDWYRSHFDPSRPVRGETSPNYTAYPLWRDVPDRMASIVPDVKLIYLVRDPIERIAAQWVHNWAVRRENSPPADALRERPTYLARSRYMTQVERFLVHFGREQILVLDQADLRHRRAETVARAFGFLGVEPRFSHPTFQTEVHTSARKRRITAVGARVERRLEDSPLAAILPRGSVSVLEGVVLPGRIERPDIMAALPAGALDELREEAARLRAFTGLALQHWSV